MTAITRIPFVKATAYGNDFLIIGRQHQGSDPAALTRRLCDRNHGIGADGVEWLSEEAGSDARIHLINADGSAAEISGNGTRCVAAHLVHAGAREELRIATDAGVVECHLTARSGRTFSFVSAMSVPVVGRPFDVDLGASRIQGVPVSMGNPHFVVFVAEFPEHWQRTSRHIQARADLFPEGINVEWVSILSPSEIAIRIYERGAGETHSSGTGSSASAAAAIATQGCEEQLAVAAPGGTQRVQWHPGQPLLLEGDASLICSGEYFL